MPAMTQPRPQGLRTIIFEEAPQEVKEGERARLTHELSRERQWIEAWGGEGFASRDDVLRAIAHGVLLPVVPSLAYRQYFQDRTSVEAIRLLDEDSCSVPFLRPQSLAVLSRVATAAHTEFITSDAGQRYLYDNRLDNIQFAVISMTRTLQYQRYLTAVDKLAFDGASAHIFGLAFDIDHSGYYVSKDGKTLPVNATSNPGWYIDDPIHALHGVLEKGSALGELNYVAELPMGRGCYHITATPFDTEALA